MARDTDTAEVTEAVATEAPEVTEAGETAAPEAVATESEAEAKPAGPTDEEITEAVNGFMAVVNAAVETHDTASGDLTDERIADVKAAYGCLNGTKVRTKARDAMQAAMLASVNELNVTKARAIITLQTAVKSTAVAREVVAKPVVNVTDAHVERILALSLVPNFVPVPDGIEENWVERVKTGQREAQSEVQAYKAYLAELAAWKIAVSGLAEDAEKPEAPAEPEVRDAVKTAAKLAAGRAPSAPRKAKGEGGASTPKAPRMPSAGKRDIRRHIELVFATLPVGSTLSFGQIARAVTEESPNGDASPGAVNSRATAATFDIPGLQVSSSPGQITKVA